MPARKGTPVKVLRAILYHIAAGLFEQPSREQADALRALVASLLYSTPEDAPWLTALAGIAQDLGHEESLREEYARLFVAGVDRIPAAPYASHWLAAGVPLSRAEVAAMMAEHGFDAGIAHGRSPDHLISELEFAAFLAERGGAVREIQERFLRGHLYHWIPRFTGALRAAAPPPRYRYAAEFLERLVAWDEAACGPPGRAH